MGVEKLDDPLKNIEDITKPDDRRQFTVETLDDLHAELSSISLHAGVPVGIRQHFETAKNVALYTWFVYRFHQVAEMQAYSSLEMALRAKLEGDEPELLKLRKYSGLFKLIGLAARCGWVRNEGFSYWNPEALRDGEHNKNYVDILQESVHDMRNNLAHGSMTLHPWSTATLRICADFINQLFVPSEAI